MYGVLWVQTCDQSSEVERQNRTLLKAIRAAHAEGRIGGKI